MIVLGIDTTTKFCEISLAINNSRFDYISLDEGLIHSKKLVYIVDRLLKKNQLDINMIEGIGVNIGPGSFTGIRVGVTSARAISQALNLKIVAINGLDAIAYFLLNEKLKKNKKIKLDSNIILCPVIDALNKKVYTSMYQIKFGRITRVKDYCMQKSEVLYNMIEEVILKNKVIIFAGDGIHYLNDFNKKYSDNIKLIENKDKTYLKSTIVHMAISGFNNCKEVDYNNLKPFYLKRSEVFI